jgi:hypothetical protein
VHSEVKNCDIVAKKEGDLIIVELKKQFSVTLLAQAVMRKEVCDSVYVALPVPRDKERPPNLSAAKTILRRLEIGLILVDFKKTKTKIEVLLHPVPFTARRRHRKRRAIIREIDGRFAEFDIAGSPASREKMSAYKQQAIRIAYFLEINGPSSPKKMKELSGTEKAQSILSSNFYGWFDRVERGVYTLNRAGKKSLKRYASLFPGLGIG